MAACEHVLGCACAADAVWMSSLGLFELITQIDVSRLRNG